MNKINFETITSRKNPRIISVCSLDDKKTRDQKNLFVVEGIKLFKELLLENLKISEIYFTSNAKDKYSKEISSAISNGASGFLVSDEVYEKISSEKNPEGILAVAEKFFVFDSTEKMDTSCGFVILDEVQNPSNVGTIIRTACALGVAGIILSRGCADIFSKKTLRASMGAVFKLNICKTENLLKEIELLKSKNLKIFATALSKDSVPVSKIKFSQNDSIVLGNEGNGISPEILSACTNKVIIPMFNNTESLNAASAATIMIWEKQKGGIS